MLMSGVWLLDEPQSYLLGSRGLTYAGRRACIVSPVNFDYKGGVGEGGRDLKVKYEGQPLGKRISSKEMDLLLLLYSRDIMY